MVENDNDSHVTNNCYHGNHNILRASHVTMALLEIKQSILHQLALPLLQSCPPNCSNLRPCLTEPGKSTIHLQVCLFIVCVLYSEYPF